ncbi:MAG: NAD(P)-dependent oxidoreductase [Cyanothece sp. SIO1E1]|nr:NAD(P)-dependent oxidoreductase [Cyanothece sp. SIO1E1]
MKKLLVTGASGFLGWHLCQLAQQAGWTVYGTYHTKTLQIPGVSLFSVDLSNFQDLKRCFQTLQPTAVIHTAAQSKPNICQADPDATFPINVTASLNLAGLCADALIPCVFTSTDLVFDGLNPPYRESDPVCPTSFYGQQKVAAETGMLARYPQTAVCRMPIMFGMAAPTAISFMQAFIQTLRQKRPLKLFTDEFRTPVSASTAAEGLLLALELLALEQIQGRLHLGGPERISRYDFGRLMIEVLRLPESGLIASLQQDVKMAAPRPPDVSLDSSLAFSLGYAPPTLRQELEGLAGKV